MTEEPGPFSRLDGNVSSRVCVEIGQNLKNSYRNAIQSMCKMRSAPEPEGELEFQPLAP